MKKSLWSESGKLPCLTGKRRFSGKSFTAHLTFTRMDLLETISKIGMEAA